MYHFLSVGVAIVLLASSTACLLLTCSKFFFNDNVFYHETPNCQNRRVNSPYTE